VQAEGTQHSLESVLQQEVQCSERLLETLDAERTALIKRDTDALEAAVAKKLEYSQLLETLDRQREAILSELGFATDRDGVRRSFDALPAGGKLNRLWQQILENIAKCQAGNLTNGGILESGRQQVEQTLRILRGQQGSPFLYTPHGETSANLGRRELGKV
jgi:flagella synthesis protein FlgN